MHATLTNGRAKKSLAEQIDRLDSILDGLSEALQQAVAEAVQAAVKAVLNEILAKPEVLAHLAASQSIPVAEKRPNSEVLAQAWARVSGALQTVVRKFVACRASIGRTCATAWAKTCEAGRRIKMKSLRMLIAGGCRLLAIRHIAAPVLAAVTLGGLTGMAASYLDPWTAGAVSAVGGLGIGLGHSTGQGWLARLWPWKAQVD